MKLRYLFYELLAIPLLVPLVHNSVFSFIMPINEETTFGDGTITCDENFNCITENANGDTFNGISPSFLTKRNWFVFFNSGLISEVYGFNTLKTYYVQQRPILICRTDYNSAINYTQTVTDYLSGCANNLNTGNAILWSEEDLGGKITSYTINTIGSNNGHSAVICANYNEDIKSACFNVRDNLGNNYDFGISDTIFNWDNFVGFGLAESSPRFGGGSSGYDPFIESEEIYYSDNKQNYMDTFNAIGFYTGLCYSDFAINDLVSDSTSFGSFFPTFGSDVLTGATIFDLKNNLFSSWSNSAWFDNLNGYYKSVDKDFSRVSLYSGHSKGYFRLFYKLNNADFIDSYTLNGKDVFSYCDMVINGYDPTDLFTGSLSPSFENIYLSLRDNPYYLSGAVDPNGPKDLKGLFNQLFTNLKGSFKIDDTLEGTPGILPTYIIFGFFLFLLYYVFRK